jgi:oxaloacetate decarboxylase gamma subunit
MERTFDLQNITEVTAQNGDKLNGLAITLTGMVIVFLALVLITLCIAILPRLLNALALILPTEHPAVKKPPRETDRDPLIASAAAAAWHQHRQGGPS